MKEHVLILLLAIVIAFLITPLIEKVARRTGAVDLPAERKVHHNPVPRLGGVAIYFSIAFALLISFLTKYLFSKDIGFAFVLGEKEDWWGIFLGSTLIFVVGIIDDIRGISPPFKFLGQVASAALVVSFGVVIEFVGNPLGGLINIPLWAGIFITIFWIVALTNTINFIDGLDGLAAGVCSIAMIALYVSALQTGRIGVTLILVTIVGSLVGFLRYNFHPARIFMGDSGSMFLGFLLGAITVQGAVKSAAAVALLVPIMIMGVPILDAAYAIWRRFFNKRPLTQADKEHIHHRLMHKGFSHRQTVLLIYTWSLLLSVVGLSVRLVGSAERLIVLGILGLVSFFLAWYSGLFDWLEKR